MTVYRTLPLALLLLAGCAAPPKEYEHRLSDWEKEFDSLGQETHPDQVLLDEDAGLSELLRVARANNAGLEAAFQRWKDALERIPGATTLPNPRLTFGGFLSELETRVGATQARIGLAQPIPWFGKLALSGDIAFEASEEARELLEAARLELDQRVRGAWYEYAWLEQAIVITGGNRDLLLHWESVSRARLEAGLGKYADVIRAQVELGKLEDRIKTLEDMRRPIVASLNAALNRPSDANLPRPKSRLQAPPQINAEQLMQELNRTNPILRAMDHRIEAAKQGVDLAGKAFYPDFMVGAEYTFIGTAVNPATTGSGDDALALTFGLELPVFRQSYRAGERAAQARTLASQREKQEALNRFHSDLEMALYQFRDADRRVGLFRESLIPKGEEAVQVLDTGYQAGDDGFLDLIDAQRVLLEFQLQAARAESDRAQALAKTEQIVGISLHEE